VVLMPGVDAVSVALMNAPNDFDIAERLEEQRVFVEAHGWGEADIFPLPADASTRTYTRLIDDQRRCLLMDAPVATEKLPEYLAVADHLKNQGLRTPQILAADIKTGFALIEDFGEQTFTSLLAHGTDEHRLYEQAVDVLVHIRNQGDAGLKVDLPPYNMELLLEEVSRFLIWFVPAARGSNVTESERECFLDAWQSALGHVSVDRSSFVFRDFHVDNLMILSGGNGVSAVGLLDFQDALIGSPAYDVMSLLEDARRDVSAQVRAQALTRYLRAFPDVDPFEFKREIILLAAQRHTKVAGIFARQSVERGNHQYLVHLPRVLRLLDEALATSALSEVREATFALVPNLRDIKLEPEN
jgi:aminoglycoside/choline kinase family phosphotransferase